MLQGVRIDAYSTELRDGDELVGDRASGRAFRDILEDERKHVRRMGGCDPFGSGEADKDDIEAAGYGADPDKAMLIGNAVEAFSIEFADAIRRFLSLPEWENTQRIVVGGGFRDSEVGQRAIERTSALLEAAGVSLELSPIRNDPNEAGLFGCASLTSTSHLWKDDGFLAVDIGGTNMRVGVVRLDMRDAPNLMRTRLAFLDQWPHRKTGTDREDAIRSLVDMLKGLVDRSVREGLSLAPFIGLGCPGVIDPDGQIEQGAQNLPGDWTDPTFNLPRILKSAIPTIGGRDTVVVLHNDAVVQGMSEAPFMRDVQRWGVMTIGTGLGNAHFTNVGFGAD